MTANIFDQGLSLEMGDRASLGRRYVGRITDDEDVGCRLGLQRVGIGRNKVEIIAQPSRATDEFGSAVQRNDDSEIKGNFSLVVRNQPTSGAIYRTSIEFGHEVDVLFCEHPCESLRCHRLRKRAVQRRDVGDIHVVARTAHAEEPIG